MFFQSWTKMTRLSALLDFLGSLDRPETEHCQRTTLWAVRAVCSV
jgi:hypothetical protein